uniref:Uncharacterized protein n=1 Tax=Setaria viridis TaxID=4556 RepID=A0A4U6V4C6_SETVI|nr:hypothetical protein SEVIR_4G276700v2 [Setaria viridis]
MARQRQEMLPNNLRERPPGDAAAAAFAPGPGGGHGVRLLLLDAGRVLMLWGWGTIAAAVSTTRNRPPDDDDAANATHAFLGLLLWLAGVSLVTFTPAARRRRFPRIARRGVAVVTNLVMGRFFPPWN